MELPDQEELAAPVDPAAGPEGEQDPIAALLAEAQKGAGGRAVAPVSAAKPTVNLYNLSHPVEAVVQGNYPLTQDPEHDVRHIILDFQGRPFPVLEGQSLAFLPLVRIPRARRICPGSILCRARRTASGQGITMCL